MAAFDERMVNGMGVLSAIVDSGSFARAAEVLAMTASGVSRSIARLETRLGLRLFDRSTRSVRLTEEGRRFYEQVKPLLDGLEEAAASAAEGATAVRGRLRVSLDPYFSRTTLGPKIDLFLEQHPQLQLELITRTDLGDIVAEGVDLALRFGQPRESALVARKLLDTRVLTVASPAYLARHGRPKLPADLQKGDHVCIQFRDPLTGRPFPWELHRGRRKLVFETRGPLTVNDLGTLLSACLAGQGIAQIMTLGTGPLIAQGLLVDLFPDWPDERFPLYALHPSRHHVPAKTRAFLDFVKALCA